MSGNRRDERTAFWLPETLTGCELFKARFRTHRYARHAHDDYALGVIEEGTQRFFACGSENTAPPLSLITLNPGTTHDGYSFADSGYEYRMVYVTPEAMSRALASDPATPPPPPCFGSAVTEDAALGRELAAIHRLADPETGVRAGALAIQTRMTRWLAALAARHGRFSPPPRGKPESRRVAAARAWLLDHIDRNVALDELAAAAGLSPFHLLRLFRAETGLPPHAWLTQARIARARDLLRAGMPLAEVATEVGFYDQAHFTRRFIAVTGLTPGQFAAAVRPDGKNVQYGGKPAA